jgi:hypothetical protein
VNLHVEQHNQHADLQEYRVAPLVENLKTLWIVAEEVLVALTKCIEHNIRQRLF